VQFVTYCIFNKLFIVHYALWILNVGIIECKMHWHAVWHWHECALGATIVMSHINTWVPRLPHELLLVAFSIFRIMLNTLYPHIFPWQVCLTLFIKSHISHGQIQGEFKHIGQSFVLSTVAMGE